jgi:hypothetical protein
MKVARPGLRVHETPLFMRLRRTRRWLQCGFGVGKVKIKRPISTVFLGVSLGFARFWPNFPVFIGI